MTTLQTPPRPAAPSPAASSEQMRQVLLQFDQPCFALQRDGRISLSTTRDESGELVGMALPMVPEQLGDPDFRRTYGVRYAYMSGAMAAGIASEDLVIAMAKEGFLASFGAGGLLPERIEKALTRFSSELKGLPYCSNLIHSPYEDALERFAVELFLRYRLPVIEASAFMDLTPHLVRYRLAGLALDPQQRIQIHHRVIAKISRPEVAERFMRPAPRAIVAQLLKENLITEQQAQLSAHVPMADDLTIEADSGGHTDRRPLIAIVPVITTLRDQLHAEFRYPETIRIGVGGGLGTPDAIHAAFSLGAAYVVTGSINQSAVESGTSARVRQMLAEASVVDVDMAPAADMFEMGVQLQVLRKGTFFPMRAKKLYELYREYPSLDAIPAAEKAKIEEQIFREPLESIWGKTAEYFNRRDPNQIKRAEKEPKRKMALIFRWYLGMASRWAVTGDPERAHDYQIWCGPAMGSFNLWVKGTSLEKAENRRVSEMARQLMIGATYHARVRQLANFGVHLPIACQRYRPTS